MNTMRWLLRGFKDALKFQCRLVFQCGLISFLMTLVIIRSYRMTGTSAISVVDIYTLVFGSYMYMVWVLPVTAVLLALNLQLQIRKRRILYYTKRENEWIELVGKTFAIELCYSISIIGMVFLVGMIVSRGVFFNEKDPYSLVQIMLHGVYVNPAVAMMRSACTVFIHLFFIGILVTGCARLTGKEYFGVLVALFLILMDSRVGVFPTVDTSYYFFISPDHSLLFAIVRTIIVWCVMIALNLRKQWDIL